MTSPQPCAANSSRRTRRTAATSVALLLLTGCGPDADARSVLTSQASDGDGTISASAQPGSEDGESTAHAKTETETEPVASEPEPRELVCLSPDVINDLFSLDVVAGSEDPTACTYIDEAPTDDQIALATVSAHLIEPKQITWDRIMSFDPVADGNLPAAVLAPAQFVLPELEEIAGREALVAASDPVAGSGCFIAAQADNGGVLTVDVTGMSTTNRLDEDLCDETAELLEAYAGPLVELPEAVRETEAPTAPVTDEMVAAFNVGDYRVAAGEDYGDYRIKDTSPTCSGNGATVFSAVDTLNRFSDPHVAYLDEEQGWVLGAHYSMNLTRLCQTFEDTVWDAAEFKGVELTDTRQETQLRNQLAGGVHVDDATLTMRFARAQCRSDQYLILSGLVSTVPDDGSESWEAWTGTTYDFYSGEFFDGEICG